MSRRVTWVSWAGVLALGAAVAAGSGGCFLSHELSRGSGPPGEARDSGIDAGAPRADAREPIDAAAECGLPPTLLGLGG